MNGNTHQFRMRSNVLRHCKILGTRHHSFCHKKLRKMAYQFIWDGRKGIHWFQMIPPKNEGGLGERDLPMITTVVPIKKGTIFLEKSEYIL